MNNILWVGNMWNIITTLIIIVTAFSVKGVTDEAKLSKTTNYPQIQNRNIINATSADTGSKEIQTGKPLENPVGKIDNPIEPIYTPANEKITPTPTPLPLSIVTVNPKVTPTIEVPPPMDENPPNPIPSTSPCYCDPHMERPCIDRFDC